MGMTNPARSILEQSQAPEREHSNAVNARQFGLLPNGVRTAVGRHSRTAFEPARGMPRKLADSHPV